MRKLPGRIRYALRQFRLAAVFTAAAALTLALGIGGATAIFTLIDAMMLRSLPVSDPGRLYRVGDGNACCVQSGPQDTWGMFSFPLYQRLKAAAPEFEQVAAFQTGQDSMSARRQGPRFHRPHFVRQQSVAGGAGGSIGGAGGRSGHVGAQPKQSGAPGFRIPDSGARARID